MTGSIFRILLNMFIVAILITGSHTAAFAQMSPIPPAATKQAVPSNKSLPEAQDEEVTIMRDYYAGEYNSSTLENLSRTYWRLGAFDFDDDEAIANYLRINDCKIVVEYLNDDIEWKSILRTMKDHLRNDKEKFPLNYQFVIELKLGRYNIQKGGFPLAERTGFVNSKRIEVSSINKNPDVCYDYNSIKDYPEGLIILLSQPFTLDFVKVDEHVAQAYLLRKKDEYSRYGEQDRITRYERNAYLRLRVTFSQYHGNIRGNEAGILAIMYGNIDGYEVFEDAAQKRLLSSVDLKARPGSLSQPRGSQVMENEQPSDVELAPKN